MKICSNNHTSIVYNSLACPVCAIADGNDLVNVFIKSLDLLNRWMDNPEENDILKDTYQFIISVASKQSCGFVVNSECTGADESGCVKCPTCASELRLIKRLWLSGQN